MPLVSVTDEGVPSAGVTKVGLVDSTTFPLPVVLADANWLEAFEAKTVALAGMPEPFTRLALMLPLPAVVSDAPVPTTIAAAVLVPEVSAEKALPPPPDELIV